MKTMRKQKIVGNGQASQALRVAFNNTEARAVALAGSFNDWRPESTPMVQVGDGRWLKELVLPPGTYEYLIVADGKWMPDPSVKESVPNPFGGVNSLATIPKHPDRKGG